MPLDTLVKRLEALREHTDPPTNQHRSRDDGNQHRSPDDGKARLADEQLASGSLPAETGFPGTIPTALKEEIVKNRVSATAASRVVEAEISAVLAQSAIPAAAMSLLMDKILSFLEALAEIGGPTWLPAQIQLSSLRRLRADANHRQQFHALRDLVPPLRHLLVRLASSHHAGDHLLHNLGQRGVLVPSLVLSVVAEAHLGLEAEILNGPSRFRLVWKPASRERLAPEDRGVEPPGPYTAHLWRTPYRVREATNPPVSEAEVRELFGPHATRATHGDEKLPWACGAHKWALVRGDPVVEECTARGLHMTSGPSGTGYRLLNLWLVLGGAQDELPAVRLAVASLLLSGYHHSLVEVMIVCAPLVKGQPETPTGLLEMIEDLVPGEVAITVGGETLCITADEFQEDLAARIHCLLWTRQE
jgi:hypothetical protein